jgi:hypothetical protein
MHILCANIICFCMYNGSKKGFFFLLHFSHSINFVWTDKGTFASELPDGIFWIFENTKNRRRTLNQPIKIKFIRFQLV